ncbi:SGNH/GDSL hydrolase family protein [Enterobacter cancerogenus]|uniref:SGNH/GDSL hydrolase family protein n=1 Tax=Enterobacter cancerogenus TaxID=69218 RepID=UPI0038221132
MKISKGLLVVVICIVGLVLSFVFRREYLSSEKSKKIQNFQSVMMDFKNMNIDQADGEYIIFGDSLIQGMSPYVLGVKYVNMGVGGYTASQITQLITSSSLDKYKKVVIEGGVNDALSQSKPEQIGRQMNEAIDAANGKEIVLVQILPLLESARKDFKSINEKIHAINGITSEHCKSIPNCSVVEVPTDFSDAPSDFYMHDGVHLRSYGYHVWANHIKLAL